jgi:sulfate permease, SulP family
VLVPKLVTTLRTYTRAQFSSDLGAGLVVGIVALPLAIAFGIASGVTPQQGLYTAIIGGFIISALGGSRVQIGGPTGAFVVIVYGVIQQHGLDGLLLATMIAGVILVAMGLLRVGGAIKFIPFPVTTGFTAGIALLIAVQQLRDGLGLDMPAPPAEFVERIGAYLEHAHTWSPYALGLTLGTVAIQLLWPRVSRKVPSPFVALIVATLAAQLLDLPVETIGSRFGEITASFPAPRLPEVSFADARAVMGPAFTIAVLAAIESLLSAVVADGMIGGRHRSNMELVAQGTANVVSPLFGGIPVTGAIARTATNIKSGGRTPVAGIVHAVVLLLITLFFARSAGLIPLAALAGILFVVAWRMSEWRVFRNELRGDWTDSLVMVTTFLLTVVFDLTVAIAVGMVLAAFLFMKRMSEVVGVNEVTREFADPEGGAGDNEAIYRRRIPPGVEVYEINGPFFFGAAERFKDTLGDLRTRPRVLIIRMRNVPAIDSTAAHALSHLVSRTRRDGTRIVVAGIQPRPLETLRNIGLVDQIGRDNIVDDIDTALQRAAALVETA